MTGPKENQDDVTEDPTVRHPIQQKRFHPECQWVKSKRRRHTGLVRELFCGPDKEVKELRSVEDMTKLIV